MHTFDSARAAVAENVSALPAEARALPAAVGCRLAAAPVADVSLPPHDVSAMDGYAIRLADLGEFAGDVRLTVSLEVPAGIVPPELPPGHAARIFTGAMVPPGADAVVMQEEVSRTDAGVQLTRKPSKGEHIRRAGEVFAAAGELARAGDLITPWAVGLLVAGGAATVRVIRRPRVAIVTTGSELVSAREMPEPGQIRDSNGPMLAAMLEAANLPLVSRDRAGDRMEAVQHAIRAATEMADVIVCSGGVSVGDYDLVPKAVNALGGQVIVHGVRMQPGKPLLVARVGERWIVGLPGNPVSALVGWRMFARPLCEMLAGNSRAFDEAPEPAHVAAAVANHGSRLQLRPATLNHRPHDWPEIDVKNWMGSHDVTAAAKATALVRLPESTSFVAGQEIGYYPMQWPLD